MRWRWGDGSTGGVVRQRRFHLQQALRVLCRCEAAADGRLGVQRVEVGDGGAVRHGGRGRQHQAVGLHFTVEPIAPVSHHHRVATVRHLVHHHTALHPVAERGSDRLVQRRSATEDVVRQSCTDVPHEAEVADPGTRRQSVHVARPSRRLSWAAMQIRWLPLRLTSGRHHVYQDRKSNDRSGGRSARFNGTVDPSARMSDAPSSTDSGRMRESAARMTSAACTERASRL